MSLTGQMCSPTALAFSDHQSLAVDSLLTNGPHHRGDVDTECNTHTHWPSSGMAHDQVESTRMNLSFLFIKCVQYLMIANHKVCDPASWASGRDAAKHHFISQHLTSLSMILITLSNHLDSQLVAGKLHICRDALMLRSSAKFERQQKNHSDCDTWH